MSEKFEEDVSDKILEAKMHGAKSALEGKKMDCNPYAESDNLHFIWLSSWVNARMEIIKLTKGTK